MKSFINSALVAIFLFIGSASCAWATTYYTDGSNPSPAGADEFDVTDVTNWTTDPLAVTYGAPFANPVDFAQNGDEFRIINSASMSASQAWDITGTGSKLVLESGSRFLSFSAADNILTLDMENAAVYTVNGGMNNLTFGTTHIGSILRFVSSGDFLRQDYPCSVEFAHSGGAYNITAGADIAIDGDLIINVTSGTVRGCQNSSAQITLGRSFKVQQGTFVGTGGTGNFTLNAVNVILTGATLDWQANNNVGATTVNLTGDLDISSGTYRAKRGSSPSVTINLTGTGTIYGKTSGLTDNRHIINISGTYSLSDNFTFGNTLTVATGASLTYSASPSGSTATIPSGITATLNGSAIISLGSSDNTFTFTGSPTLNNTSSINVGSAAGTINLNAATTLNGTSSIIVGTGTVNVNQVITYSGGSLSGSGTGTLAYSSTHSNNLPAVSVGTLSIGATNSPTVTLTGNVTATTGVTIGATGTLSLGTNKLTIAGTSGIVKTGTLTASAGTIEYTETAPLPAVTVGTLTINGSGKTVTMGGNVSVSTLLNLTAGTLTIGANTLTLNGTVTTTGGTLTGGSSSNLSVATVGASAITLPAVTLNNLTLNRTAGIGMGGAISVGGVLTLTAGTLTTTGQTFTLNLSTGYIDKAGTGAISGNITATKSDISRSGFIYLGSPVQGTIDFGNCLGYTYTESSHDIAQTVDPGWVSGSPFMSYSSGNMLQGFAGYYPSGASVSFTGTYDHSADYTLGLSYTNTNTDPDNGWHLVANPFPASVDWAAGVTHTNIDDAVYIYNGSSYTQYAGGVPGPSYIAPAQGFFVKANSGGGTLTIPKSSRQSTTANTLRTAGTSIANVLEITATSKTLSDKTYLRLTNDATVSFDSKFDAYKLDNDASVPMIYTELGAIKYSINAIKKDTTNLVPLKIKASTTDTYTLNFAENAPIESGVELYLIDKLLNKTQDIRLNPVYTASLVKGDTSSRFYISTKATVTGLADTEEAYSVSVENGIITTYFKNINTNNTQVSVLNNLGQEVYRDNNANIQSGKYTFAPNVKQTGIYIVRITTGTKVYSEKVLINN